MFVLTICFTPDSSRLDAESAKHPIGVKTRLAVAVGAGDWVDTVDFGIEEDLNEAVDEDFTAVVDFTVVADVTAVVGGIPSIEYTDIALAPPQIVPLSAAQFILQRESSSFPSDGAVAEQKHCLSLL